MADRTWDLVDARRLSYDDTLVSCVGREVRLRRTIQGTGIWTDLPEGVYPPFGVVTLEDHVASGIESLYAFEVDADVPSGTSLGWQISNDGGSTWYRWNGAAWVVATTLYSTTAEIDANVATFPLLLDRRVRFRARLSTSTDLSLTPVLRQATLYLEYRFNVFEDVKRTLRRKLTAVQIPVTLTVPVEVAPLDQVALDTEFSVVPSTIVVYNLTTDPNRLTNLYLSYASGVITLTGAQTLGNAIEVRFSGTVPAFVGADEDYQLSVLPCFVLLVDEGKEDLSRRSGADLKERRLADNTYRKRQDVTWYQHRVKVQCLSKYEATTLVMASAIDDYFEAQFDMSNEIRSLACGESFEVVDYTGMVEQDQITKGLMVKQADFQLNARGWRGPKTSGKLMTQPVNIVIEQL